MLSQSKTFVNSSILLKGVLISDLLNNSLASCFIINLDLLLHTRHFDKIIVFSLLVFKNFAFILSASFLQIKNMITEFLLIVLFYYGINFLD